MVSDSVAREVERYMALPYRIELIPDPEDGGYAVAIPNLPGCLSQGDTADEAIEMIRDAQRLWIEAAIEDGRPVPEPRPIDEYSGKFNVRVPRRVHRALTQAARDEGVSLNLFVASTLAEAVGQRTGRRPVAQGGNGDAVASPTTAAVTTV